MILQVFADESGTHDASGSEQGSEVAVVAGYMSWNDDWNVFCEEWSLILETFDVPVFHMADFVDSRREGDPTWPYRGWQREKKDDFIRSLARTARDNTLVGIGGLVSTKDYARIFPTELKTAVVHPYHFCFQLFFDTLLDAMRSKFEAPFEPDVQVECIFDRQQEFKQDALLAFNNIRSSKDVEGRLGSITFADKTAHVALQAADLVAYRMRKMLTRKLRGELPVNVGSWDDELVVRGNLVMNYYDSENLELIARLWETGKTSSVPGSQLTEP